MAVQNPWNDSDPSGFSPAPGIKPAAKPQALPAADPLRNTDPYAYGFPPIHTIGPDAKARSRYVRDALRDRTFLMQYFGVPQDVLSDAGFLDYARKQALSRGAALQSRLNWWDNPRAVEETGYRSLLSDRGAQGAYLLQQYGFDPFSGQMRDPLDPTFLSAAAARGQRLAQAYRDPGMIDARYGSEFSLSGAPGQVGIPFGYHQFTNEVGDTYLVDGNGNIIR